ncbi:MAG: hypothetical protein HY799_08470 [Nitrosomonadales bacterium]|nr:hypothetical protein [Nitrosomonadales bacterium]
MKYLPVILAALALTACADPERNLYEGIKTNNDAKRSPNERAMTPAPTYDEYKKERDAQSAK